MAEKHFKTETYILVALSFVPKLPSALGTGYKATHTILPQSTLS